MRNMYGSTNTLSSFEFKLKNYSRATIHMNQDGIAVARYRTGPAAYENMPVRMGDSSDAMIKLSSDRPIAPEIFDPIFGEKGVFFEKYEKYAAQPRDTARTLCYFMRDDLLNFLVGSIRELAAANNVALSKDGRHSLIVVYRSGRIVVESSNISNMCASFTTGLREAHYPATVVYDGGTTWAQQSNIVNFEKNSNFGSFFEPHRFFFSKIREDGVDSDSDLMQDLRSLSCCILAAQAECFLSEFDRMYECVDSQHKKFIRAIDMNGRIHEENGLGGGAIQDLRNSPGAIYVFKLGSKARLWRDAFWKHAHIGKMISCPIPYLTKIAEGGNIQLGVVAPFSRGKYQESESESLKKMLSKWPSSPSLIYCDTKSNRHHKFSSLMLGTVSESDMKNNHIITKSASVRDSNNEWRRISIPIDNWAQSVRSMMAQALQELVSVGMTIQL